MFRGRFKRAIATGITASCNARPVKYIREYLQSYRSAQLSASYTQIGLFSHTLRLVADIPKTNHQEYKPRHTMYKILRNVVQRHATEQKCITVSTSSNPCSTKGAKNNQNYHYASFILFWYRYTRYGVISAHPIISTINVLILIFFALLFAGVNLDCEG